MNVVWAVFIFVAVFEVCGGISIEKLRKRRLSKTLNFHPSLDIINGTKVKIQDYPFMASMRIGGIISGSGIVINSKWILTSADSVFDTAAEAITVKVGSVKWSLGGQDIPAQQIIVHENFTWESLDYNIALVKVNKTMKFGKKLQPATLGTKALKEGTSVTVVGWGETTTDVSEFPASEYLLATSLTVMNKQKCEEALSTKLASSFCTSVNHSRGPCEYDTGDPVVVNGTVYGVYTLKEDCVTLDSPPVYTDITAFLPWIQSHISEDA